MINSTSKRCELVSPRMRNMLRGEYLSQVWSNSMQKHGYYDIIADRNQNLLTEDCEMTHESPHIAWHAHKISCGRISDGYNTSNSKSAIRYGTSESSDLLHAGVTPQWALIFLYALLLTLTSHITNDCTQLLPTKSHQQLPFRRTGAFNTNLGIRAA